MSVPQSVATQGTGPLPSGTVTFLFTDIKTLGDAFYASLAPPFRTLDF